MAFICHNFRGVLDYIEETTTKMADEVLVNSKFTADVFKETFTTIKFSPKVLYPSLNTNKFDEYKNQSLSNSESLEQFSGKKIFLSLNRFERKKNLGLAIEAFSFLQKNTNNTSAGMDLMN